MLFLTKILTEKCPGFMQKAGLHWHSIEAEGLRLKTNLDLLHALGPLLRNGLVVENFPYGDHVRGVYGRSLVQQALNEVKIRVGQN
jgi:hypothetical protein